MSRDYSLYLNDVLESCEKVRTYVSGMTFDSFKVDLEVVWGITKNRIDELETAVSSIIADIREVESE